MALNKPFDMKEIRDKKPQFMSIWEIPLDTQLTNYELKVTGDFFQILECTGEATIRMNEETAPEIEASKVKRVTAPFYRLFITTPEAQSNGNIRFVIGKDAGFRMEERRTSFDTILDLQSETVAQGASTNYSIPNVSGYKKIFIYLHSNKVAVFKINYQPLGNFQLGTYVEMEQIPQNNTSAFPIRIIDFPIKALQIGVSNDDTADDATVSLIVTGEK